MLSAHELLTAVLTQMPRAPFNTTCDLIWGPLHPGAGTIRVADVPCRVVNSLVIDEQEFPLNLEEAYVTMEEMPIGYGTYNGLDQALQPFVTWEFDNSDRLAIPAGGAATHGIIWHEAIPARPGQAAYYRCRIMTLPLPTTHS